MCGKTRSRNYTSPQYQFPQKPDVWDEDEAIRERERKAELARLKYEWEQHVRKVNVMQGKTRVKKNS